MSKPTTKTTKVLKWVIGIPVGFILLLLVIGIFAPKDKNETIVERERVEPKEEVTYSVTDKKEFPSNNKINVEVALSKAINDSELPSIAEEIKEDIGDFENTYIFYFVTGHPHEAGAYAVSHFQKDKPPMIKILGATADEIIALKKIKAPGKILGDWVDPHPTGDRLVLYESNNNVYLVQYLKGSTGKVDPVKVTLNGSRIDNGNTFGEYYQIEPSGDLGMYNKSNTLFALAKKSE